MRMRKKKNLVPRMEACGALLLPTPAAAAEQKGRWRETLMPQAKELHLELGCGKGRSLCCLPRERWTAFTSIFATLGLDSITLDAA